MRSHSVVVLLPVRQHLAGVDEAAEHGLVQELVAQATVEALDEAGRQAHRSTVCQFHAPSGRAPGQRCADAPAGNYAETVRSFRGVFFEQASSGSFRPEAKSLCGSPDTIP